MEGPLATSFGLKEIFKLANRMNVAVSFAKMLPEESAACSSGSERSLL
jgi:hypothetical protein